MFGGRRVARRTARRTSRRTSYMMNASQPDEPQPTYEQPPPPQEPAEPEYMAELEQLNQLKLKGILSEEEYEAKKKQILGL